MVAQWRMPGTFQRHLPGAVAGDAHHRLDQFVIQMRP